MDAEVAGMQRERPDGIDDESDELDPRVEVELEKLNTASNDINILEKELDEARSLFRQWLTDAARKLKLLAKDIGSHIDKSRPYFEAVNQAKKAQLECQNAVMTFERACQLHKGARETISVAEEKLQQNPGMFDAAWQEMLNNANQKIMEAEKEKLKNEILHQEAAMAYRQLQERVLSLEKQLKKSINKARPYFDQRTQYLGYLETQKERVQSLEKSYASAKTQYSVSLRNLELISEDIHKKRNEAVNPVNAGTPVRPREECYGAESQKKEDQPQSRRRSLNRKISEERIKQAIAQKKYARGRFRSSLVSELDIDFDLDDSLDYGDELTRSPGAKSVDIGCVKLNYYDDYQVLDVAPFMEREKALRNQSKTSSNVKRQDTPRPGSQIETTVRTTLFRSNNSLTSVEEANLSEVCENNKKHLEKESDSSSSKVSLTRKHSRLKFSKQFPKIEEDQSSEYLTKDDGKQNEITSYDNESNEIVKKDQKHKDGTQSVVSLNSEGSAFAEIGIPEGDCKRSFDKDTDDTFDNVEEPET